LTYMEADSSKQDMARIPPDDNVLLGTLSRYASATEDRELLGAVRIGRRAALVFMMGAGVFGGLSVLFAFSQSDTGRKIRLVADEQMIRPNVHRKAAAALREYQGVMQEEALARKEAGHGRKAVFGSNYHHRR